MEFFLGGRAVGKDRVAHKILSGLQIRAKGTLVVHILPQSRDIKYLRRLKVECLVLRGVQVRGAHPFQEGASEDHGA